MSEETSTRNPKQIYHHFTELNDTFYLGTTNQLEQLVNDQVVNLLLQYPKLATDIRSLLRTDLNLLVGTKSEGLYYVQNQQVFQLSKKNGLLSNHISSLLSITPDTLLVGSNLGVNRIVRGADGHFEVSGQLSKYSGLPTADILDMALTIDTLWLLTRSHLMGMPLTAFNTESIGSCYVNIAQFMVNGQFFPDTLSPQLKHKQNRVSFEVEKIVYGEDKLEDIYIQLLGDTPSWRKAKSGSIQYSNLSPGNYTFRVAATKADIERKNWKEYSFNILKPFYLKYWFLCLSGIFISGSTFLFFKVLRNRKQREIANTELTKQLKMKALAAQIKPHFTFNVLNSIQNLILEKNKYEATERLADFSGLMRKLLEVADRSFINLQEDIALLVEYMDFEKLRLNDTFDYTIEIEQSALAASVPPLIIQPLVENAIWHGVNKRPQKDGKILIRIKDMGAKLQFQIKDNGNNLKVKTTKMHNATSKGIGLVKERIRLANERSNTADQFQFTPSNEGVEITFYLFKNLQTNEA